MSVVFSCMFWLQAFHFSGNCLAVDHGAHSKGVLHVRFDVMKRGLFFAIIWMFGFRLVFANPGVAEFSQRINFVIVLKLESLKRPLKNGIINQRKQKLGIGIYTELMGGTISIV